jgi:hypothetical protein
MMVEVEKTKLAVAESGRRREASSEQVLSRDGFQVCKHGFRTTAGKRQRRGTVCNRMIMLRSLAKESAAQKNLKS